MANEAQGWRLPRALARSRSEAAFGKAMTLPVLGGASAESGSPSAAASSRAGTGSCRTSSKARLGVTSPVCQRMKTDAWSARLRTGPGKIPSTMVTVAPTAMAVEVSALGITTVGPSGAGSEKNMSTTTRM